ncbi:Rhodanese-like domain containing protein [Tritrichomonas foetus]|uniref:protein-tyrosine-phosphatase n=1 Tax=Tritrichomonas foetus TaxID=1144522 RepID=A0A1J4KBM5_9EUKA|nr:Rhodanese-like domain containing protein [Tritrichomonas foetus]|eukprot:OHT08627.1 Rhodanese-like domain containing protein [Tritrichomonas foetus]
MKNKTIIPSIPFIGNVPKITGETLVDLLTGRYDELFDSLYIIDSRYNYEYNGGHIVGATNVNSSDVLKDMFFKHVIPNTIIVFHCEFSHNRGPQLASVFRETDRNLNRMEYPNLFYPNVFILDGGYRLFYQEHQDFCEGGYTTMLDDAHRINGDLTRATNEFRRNVEKLEHHFKADKPLPKMEDEDDFKSLFENDKNNKTSYEFLKSPTPWSCSTSQSPVSSKMLNFFSSPAKPRRVMKPDI